MSGPNAASPANGAASKTDTPRIAKESLPAEKPARFAVGRVSGQWFIFQDGRFARVVGLESISFDRESDALAMAAVLNEVHVERRGDNPSDVQRQLLEELRELVRVQKQGLADVTRIAKEQVAAIRGQFGEVARPERPELNVNDLMIEVARSFGLSDAASRSIGDLKGFCAAAYDMRSAPQSAERPLLILAARGVLGADKVGHARAVCEVLGLDIG